MKLNNIFSAIAAGVITAVSVTFAASAEDVVLFEGEASSSDWGQAWKDQTVENDGSLDPGLFQPGSVIYVTYSGTSPEVILQSWSGGEGWAKVAASEDDGSVAKFTYEDMAAAFNTDDMSLLDCLNVGDTGGEITVKKVVISTDGDELDAENEDAAPEETASEETADEETAEERGPVNTGIENAAVVMGIALAGTFGILVSRKKK